VPPISTTAAPSALIVSGAVSGFPGSGAVSVFLAAALRAARGGAGGGGAAGASTAGRSAVSSSALASRPCPRAGQPVEPLADGQHRRGVLVGNAEGRPHQPGPLLEQPDRVGIG
jgi:hypothetical protein